MFSHCRKFSYEVNWMEAHAHTHKHRQVQGGWSGTMEAGLTQMSQSATYQHITLTDSSHASANSNLLLSHTSIQAAVLFWLWMLFYLQGTVTSYLASLLDDHPLQENIHFYRCLILNSCLEISENLRRISTTYLQICMQDLKTGNSLPGSQYHCQGWVPSWCKKRIWISYKLLDLSIYSFLHQSKAFFVWLLAHLFMYTLDVNSSQTVSLFPVSLMKGSSLIWRGLT